MSDFGHIFGGLLTSFGLQSVNRKQYDKRIERIRGELDRELAPFRQGFQEGRSELKNMLGDLDYRDVLGEYNQFVDSYKSSPYQNYLQDSAVNATSNLAAEAGLLQSTRGRQEIANTASIASSSGMNDYLGQIMNMRNTTLSAQLQGNDLNRQYLAGEMQAGTAYNMAGDRTKAEANFYGAQQKETDIGEVYSSRYLEKYFRGLENDKD